MMAKDWICSQCGEWHSDHPSAISKPDPSQELVRENSRLKAALSECHKEIFKLRDQLTQLPQGNA